jgi:Fe-S-cluster containining protein
MQVIPLLHHSGSGNLEHKKGFPYSFNPSACQTCRGNCCRAGGYVWVTIEEVEQIAAVRKMDLESFYGEYVRLVQGHLSLQDRLINSEYICCFFDPIKCCCTIYQHRPEQCRSYPFWEQFKEKTQELLQECPGVNLTEGDNE